MSYYIAAAGAYIVYVLMAFATAKFLNLTGVDFWVLFSALTIIGALAVGVYLWFRSRQKAAAAPEAAPDAGGELEALIRGAEAKLASSRAAQGAGLNHLPLLFVVGEQGTTKTSTVLHSGLDPELLAGQVYQETQVTPTRHANLWFARGMILAEAAARLLHDPAAWTRLVRRLRPGSLKSVVGGGANAPRAAVVCVDCETFTRGLSPDQLAAVARNLQARLVEISSALGISFPVYVLLTKADRIPFFTDYVRTLTNEEAAQVLGITLPMRAAQSTGVYGEEETQRLTQAFTALLHKLCDKRLDFLPRETDYEKVPGAYEFPREFRKLRGPLVQFLVDMCRPSQLNVSPFLRGFYFSGVRPVVVEERAVPAAPVPQQRSAQTAGSATGIFSVPGFGQPAPQAAVEFVGTKKVPQWLFLSRLFHQVILQDRAAMSASAASTRTSTLQRVLLASAALLFLVLSVAWVVSFARNRGLANQAVAAANAIPASEAAGATLASADALKRLETLRQTLEQLTIYERDGAPLSYRWGLYAGSDMYPQVRRVYYARFRQLLFGATQEGLRAHLEKVPAAPGPSDDYGYTYDTLKGYLITTSHHDKSTRQFLSPLLLARWSKDRGVDAERLALAQKQFDFYAEDLKTANPYTSENDAAAVDRSRRYLAQFSGTERVYQFMLAEAGKTNAPVNYNKRFPGSAEVVINNRDVPGAFTKGGWNWMQNALKRADQFFGGERWVLGDYASAAVDRAKLEQDLQARYLNDFINHWRNYIKGSVVVRYGGLKDAAKKLNVQSGNQSPILALFWLASQNTGVKHPKVAEAFQPVHAVVPPEVADRYIAPPNQPYINGLLNLQVSVDQVANNPGTPDAAAAGPTLSAASNAKLSVRQVAQSFRIDQEAHIENSVQKLMEDPITYVEGLLRALGPAELNAKGKGLCAQFAATTGKFPFNPSAAAEATVQEVNALLKPGDGALWVFYEMNLKTALVRQGNMYVASPNAPLPLNPAFIAFFNNAARFSEMLYKPGSTEPRFTYSLTPLRSEGFSKVTLVIDGQTLDAAGSGGPAKQLVWQGGGTHGARLSGKFGGQDLTLPGYDGLWAAFRLFNDAERWEPAGAGYNLDWIIRFGGRAMTTSSGNPLAARFFLDLGGTPAFFRKGALAGIRCVSQVAR
ncbi:MAG: hypothetical protein HYZ57_03950 [Acidobacteria bacterium]|nr:hypothetical protein [Acidobacteriota bacterium]